MSALPWLEVSLDESLLRFLLACVSVAEVSRCVTEVLISCSVADSDDGIRALSG
jgi:hypothetical protein